MRIPFHHPAATLRGTDGPRSRLIPWLKLLIGIVAVWVFIFGVGRLAALVPGAARMARVIEEHDIRATAIYYTDFEASAEGSEYIRHSLEYPSNGPD